MARDNESWIQHFDEIKAFFNPVKATIPLKFWKHHTKAVFPECITRDQNSILRFIQHDRMIIMTRAGMNFPLAVAKFNASTRDQ